MKNLLLATVSIVALGAVTPEFGADLPAQPVQPLYTKASQPVAAAIYDWSGYYIRMDGGFGSSSNFWDFIAARPRAVMMRPAQWWVARSAIDGRWARSSVVLKARETGLI